MRLRKGVFVCFITSLIIISSVFTNESCKQVPSSKLRFEISFPSSVHPEAITGRVFVMITKDEKREPRLQAGSWSRSVPFFGLDVESMKPGEVAVIDESILGYPPKSLREITMFRVSLIFTLSFTALMAM